jgi:cytochrome P450
MMTHPDQFRQVIAAPQLAPQAIEECLRWMPSGFVLPRIVARDTEMNGVKMPAGSSICGVFGVANRDERIWSNPHEFDIHRERKLHLTFSMGTHACMGQQLARQSFNHVMRALTQHLPDIVADADPKDLKTTGYVIRCPEKVPVRFA